jgi:hypothetical protein
MKDRQPFDLTLPLAAWNAGLSLFSFIGMFRTVPFLVGSILAHPYEKTICGKPEDPDGNISSQLYKLKIHYMSPTFYCMNFKVMETDL